MQVHLCGLMKPVNFKFKTILELRLCSWDGHWKVKRHKSPGVD